MAFPRSSSNSHWVQIRTASAVMLNRYKTNPFTTWCRLSDDKGSNRPVSGRCLLMFRVNMNSAGFDECKRPSFRLLSGNAVVRLGATARHHGPMDVADYRVSLELAFDTNWLVVSDTRQCHGKRPPLRLQFTRPSESQFNSARLSYQRSERQSL